MEPSHMDPSPDASLAAVALHQHGAFALRQAREAGFTDHQVRERVRIGRWVRLARGVFAIAGTMPSWQQQAAAALLARPSAHLCDLSAGQVHGLVDAPLRRPSLVVPPGTSGRTTLGTVRRIDVPPWQVTEVDGLRCTTVGRTLVDLARLLPRGQLSAAVDTAMGRRSTSMQELARICEGAGHVRRGARAQLLSFASTWEGIRPGSPGEARLLRCLDEWGFAPPQRQVPVTDGSGEVIARLDLGWPEPKVALEYDGIAWHGPSRWAADEGRHRSIEAAGWTVLHVGGRDLLPSTDLPVRLRLLLGERVAR